MAKQTRGQNIYRKLKKLGYIVKTTEDFSHIEATKWITNELEVFIWYQNGKIIHSSKNIGSQSLSELKQIISEYNKLKIL
jgi:hypothetical protein